MPASATAILPEQGQLVDVRQRRFVVADIADSSLPEDPLRPESRVRHHLVSLISVDDDGLGEQLQVLWELEPGTRVLDKLALPEPSGFDDPTRLDAFLDAVRWGASSSADMRAIQSPFRSGIQIEDYQLDPVVRAIQMPRVNLLVADDVGLGKTIEAGLVILELLLRHRSRSVLVVCPSSLQIQWQQQMRDKFGLEFRIVDSELMRLMRRKRGLHVNPWTHYPRLVTSIDFLKRERPIRLLREVLPQGDQPVFPRKFDVLVVDEAHNVAPAGRGKYATDSLRTAAIRTLAPHFEHKLFLSATPHNGYPESFSALLELLDNQRFARGVKPDRDQLQAVMVRRLKSELPPLWDGTPRFPRRVLDAIEVNYAQEERRAHTLLRTYAGLRQSPAADQLERYATEFVLKLLKKRLFSSPAAFAATLEKHLVSLRETRRRASVRERPSFSILQREIDKADEEFGNDEEFETATVDAVDTASRLFREPTTEEAAVLKELQSWAERARSRSDSKAAKLCKWLGLNLKPGGVWNQKRVIIFTEYRDTQKWLQSILTAEGFGGESRLETLYGGMDKDERERIKAAFLYDPAEAPVRILLATDAASEGIDLQLHCNQLIHYEIPWNPVRLEQRNGRIDRHGQRASDVRVYHFVCEGYRADRPAGAKVGDLEADLEFLMRAAEKVNTIREDLGKVGPVIAEQVEEAMLGRRAELNTQQAEKDAEPVRKLLKFERNLREQIARLYEQLQETRREQRLDPENVQTVVETALDLAGQPPLVPIEYPGIWPDPTGKYRKCPIFRLPSLGGSWALCSEGLAHPHTREIRPIVFDHDLAADNDKIVLVHLNHRLVQMSLALLRAEVWSHEGNKSLHRVTARLAPNAALDAPAIIAYARLVVTGSRGDRLHEELITAGGLLKEGRFQRLNVGQMKDLLSQAEQRPPGAAMKKKLADLWPQHSGPLRQALEARMKDRVESLEKFLAERAKKEAGDIASVLSELERSIREELKDPAFEQLQLFGFEKDQAERDIDALRARLAEIPGEIARETDAIRQRYASLTPRVFPAAVVYLVPERMA